MQNSTKMLTPQHKLSIINNYYSQPPAKNTGETLPTIWTQLEDEITKVEEYIQAQIHQRIQEIIEQDIQPRMNHLKKLGNQINGLTNQLEQTILSFKEIALEVNHIHDQITTKQIPKKVDLPQVDTHSLISIRILRLPTVVGDQTGYILKDKVFNIFSEEI